MLLCRYARGNESCVDDGTSLLLKPTQMLRSSEALGVDFVYILSARRASGEPALVRDDFQASDGSVIAWRAGELGDDGIAGEGFRLYQFR